MLRAKAVGAIALLVAALCCTAVQSQEVKSPGANSLALFELGEKLGSLRRTAELIDPALEKLEPKRKEQWTKTKKALTDESAGMKSRLVQPDFDLKAANESLNRLERELAAWEGYAQLLQKDRPIAAAGGFRELPGLNGAVILHGDIVQLRAIELLEQIVKDPEKVRRSLQQLIPAPKAGESGPLGKQLQEMMMKEVERIKKESEKPPAKK